MHEMAKEPHQKGWNAEQAHTYHEKRAQDKWIDERPKERKKNIHLKIELLLFSKPNATDELRIDKNEIAKKEEDEYNADEKKYEFLLC